MRTLLAFAAAGAMFASSFALPSVALADNCTNAGTVVGGVAGAVLGNSVSRGGGKTGGTIIGGVGGAVVGHEIAKRNCGQRASDDCRWRSYRSQGQTHRYRECRDSNGTWRRAS